MSGDSSVTGTRNKAVQGFDIVGELKDKGNPQVREAESFRLGAGSNLREMGHLA